MPDYGEQTQAIQSWVERLNNGDGAARDELLQLANERLLRLTRRMKKEFNRVGRWEETEDIFQQAAIRLHQSLQSVQLTDANHFLRLAATQIRRQLIDLSRRYFGAEGAGRHHVSQAGAGDRDASSPPAYAFEVAEVSLDPQRMQEWSDFHQLIDDLPDEEREVVDLLWYHEMTQEEAAAALNVSLKTVKRRWRAARLALHDKLGGKLPGEN